MKQKNKLYISIGLFLIAISLIFGLLLLSNQKGNLELNKCKEQPLQTNNIYQSIYEKAATKSFDIIASNQEQNPTATIEPDSTEETQNPLDEQKENPPAIAYITIETDKKTETYAIMPDVEEETLRNDLGHLPTSVLPGQEGLCVIMGHRDTQFSILRYCKIGDRIIVEAGNIECVYIIYRIDIIDNDKLLKFDAVCEKSLALVTCYPFQYTGHAPQKYIVYAIQSNDKT